MLEDDENMMALNPFARSEPAKEKSKPQKHSEESDEDKAEQYADSDQGFSEPSLANGHSETEPLQSEPTPQPVPPIEEVTPPVPKQSLPPEPSPMEPAAAEMAPDADMWAAPVGSPAAQAPMEAPTADADEPFNGGMIEPPAENFSSPVASLPQKPQMSSSAPSPEMPTEEPLLAESTEVPVEAPESALEAPQTSEAPAKPEWESLPDFPMEKKALENQKQAQGAVSKSEIHEKAMEFADSIESVLDDRRGMTSLQPDRNLAHNHGSATDVAAASKHKEDEEDENADLPAEGEAGMNLPEGEEPPIADVSVGEDEKQRKRPMRIGEKLIAHGLISEDQLQVALQEQKTRKKLLGAILVEMGFITESTLGEVLAESTGSKKFDPKSTMLDPELTSKIPKQVATRHKIIPISLNEDLLTIATPDVYNVLAIDQIKRHFPRNTKIETIYSSESEVLELIDKYYEYELSIDGILQEIETGIREKGEIDSKEDGYTNPTVRLVNAILVDAIHRGASDIHFEPEGQFLRLRYRVDGDLEQVRSFHRDYWPAIAVRIKIISGMNIAESRMPQDGRINFEIMGREVDFRVATQPTVHGENIVMRLLDKTKSLVPLGELGFADHSVTLLKRMLKRPEGIIIVTGPTGSGKTTTLYSILNYINSINVNIMTLEDPVEYQLSLIRQSNVQEGTVDFHSGIKSLMRQDPDIIFIGEVRDEETALMTVRAALTGHQVFTTLHTNDALGAVPRLSDIGVPGHLLAGSLIATMAQRLARKLCGHCKKPRLARPEESRMLGYMPDQPPTIYEPVGCSHCQQKGYKGRTAILEILNVDDGMAELIATNATRNVMLEYALENGFITMMDDGIDKVIKGEIDLNQLIETVDMTERL